MVKSLLKKVIKHLTGKKSEAAPAPAPAAPSDPNGFRPSRQHVETKTASAEKPREERRERRPDDRGGERRGPRPQHGQDRPPRRDGRREGPRDGQREAPREGGGGEGPRGQHDGPRDGHRDDRRRGGGGGRSGRRDHGPRDGAPRDEASAPEAPAKPYVDHHEGWSIAQYDVPVEHGKTRFYDLNIHDRLLHAVADLGFQYCTPIQAEVLPHTLTGRDAFGQAQTGTGKTAAFMIATLDYFLRNPIQGERRVGRPRALVIAPTRELVMQIHKDAVALSKYMNIECSVLFGGADYEKQQRQLQNKVIDIVSATPGRLLDFKRRGDLDLGGVEVLIIDEADRMLDMGFIPDVREIVHSTPPKTRRQTMLFSATFTDEIRKMASAWTKDPVTITIEPESVAVDTVEQVIYIVTLNERFSLIHHVLNRPDVDRAIVFVNRRYEAEKLADQLCRYGFNCDLLSGAVPQNKRTRTLELFREGKIKVLVATDVAGRGLHVDGVSHVINFSMPDDPEDYVHRIGRTGRAGKSGVSISFATEDDAYEIPKIEAYIGRPLPCTHPEDAWLVLPEPPANAPAPRHQSNSRPPRPNTGRPHRRPGGRRP